MGVSLESWLKNLEDKITTEIQERRSYDSYFFRTFYDADPFYIWKHDLEPETITRRGATITRIPSPKIDLVTPKIINLEYSGNWKSLFEEQRIVHINPICKEAILKEQAAVVETLMKDIKEVKVESADFIEIRRAQEIIESHDKFADILLIHPITLTLLLKTTNFRHKSMLHPYFVESQGKDYVGELGTLSVFWTFGLPKNVGLMYNKGSAYLRIHPLDIGFDSYVEPKVLRIFEELYAWFDKEDVGVKVLF